MTQEPLPLFAAGADQPRLAELPEIYRTLFEQSPDPIFVEAEDGTVLAVNPAACRLHGTTADRLLGRNVRELVPPEHRATVDRDFPRLLSGELAKLESWSLTADGRPLPVELTSTRLTFGGRAAVLLHVRDISARQAAREALRASEARLRLILDQLPAVVWTSDPELRFTSSTGAGLAALGLRPGEVVGRSVFDFFGTTDPDAWPIVAHRRALAGETVAFEVGWSGRQYEAHVEPLRDPQTGAILGCVGVAVDQTARARAEQESRLLQQIALAFGEAGDLTGAIGIVLRSICQVTGWPYGEAWVPRADAAALVCSPAWHGGDASLADFHRESAGLSFAPKQGLPGLVWSTRQPAFVRDLGAAGLFGRAAAAQRAGLSGALAFPVIIRGEVAGVLVFLQRRPEPDDVRLQGLVTGVANQLGALLDRRRALDQLQQRERQLAAAQRLAGLGSWEWDATTNRLQWSEEMFRIYGTAPAEFDSTLEGYLQRVHPADRARSRSLLNRSLRDRQPFSFEERILTPDGTERRLHTEGEPVVGPDGRATRLVGYSQDITERRAAEQALRASEERRRVLTDYTNDMITWQSPDGVIKDVTPSCQTLLGYEPEELIGRNPVEFLHADDVDTVRRSLASVLATSETVITTFRMRGKDGRFVWFETASAAIRDADTGQPAQILAISRDVSERRWTEERLRASREELRNLATRLQETREGERTRIARAVHDEVGQALTGLKMDLAWLGKRVHQVRTPEALVTLDQKVAAMLKTMDDTLQTVRRIATELRPGVLDDLGLVAAIEWQTGEFQIRTGIRCRLRKRARDVKVPGPTATAVFRVFQEVLTNIARHAQATEVQVALEVAGGRLSLRVADNGRGMTAEQATASKSLGLIGMRERAALVGGDVAFAGEANKGTVVTVTVPLAPPAAAPETP